MCTLSPSIIHSRRKIAAPAHISLSLSLSLSVSHLLPPQFSDPQEPISFSFSSASTSSSNNRLCDLRLRLRLHPLHPRDHHHSSSSPSQLHPPPDLPSAELAAPEAKLSASTKLRPDSPFVAVIPLQPLRCLGCRPPRSPYRTATSSSPDRTAQLLCPSTDLLLSFSPDEPRIRAPSVAPLAAPPRPDPRHPACSVTASPRPSSSAPPQAISSPSSALTDAFITAQAASEPPATRHHLNSAQIHRLLNSFVFPLIAAVHAVKLRPSSPQPLQPPSSDGLLSPDPSPHRRRRIVDRPHWPRRQDSLLILSLLRILYLL